MNYAALFPQLSVFISLLLTLSFLLTGCGGTGTGSEAAETKTDTLWSGTTQSDLRSKPMEYTGELTAEKLAEGLSEWTGLDFFVTDSDAPDGITVDWEKSSTLIARLDDREQKEDFHFYDAESLRWFMMDSLRMTLVNNIGVENVYYTMDGGQTLIFDELSPISEFPVDLPYMGSVFYFSHGDGRGDLIENNSNGTDSGSDPGDTGQPEWWGTYKSDELGFSVIITEYSETGFWAEISLLRDGSIVLAAQASISPEDEQIAAFGDFGLSFHLSDDFSTVEITGPEKSEWAHLFGTYEKME